MDTKELSLGVTPREALHVIWRYGSGGMEPGDFTKSLMDTIARADPENRMRLYLGFPGYVVAVDLAMNYTEGMALLRQRAGLPEPEPKEPGEPEPVV